MTELCMKPTPCQLLLGKGTCGHQVLYGPDECWRMDGKAGKEGGAGGV